MECESFRDDMLAVLYGEADAGTAARFEAHRTSCAACGDELAGLRSLRRTLETWSIPEKAVPGARSGDWAGLRRLAAAAGLLLALGGALGLSGMQVQYSRGGVSIRLGRGGIEDVRPLLDGLEQRQRQQLKVLEERLHAPAGARPAAQSPPHDAALLPRVEALIRDSEARQQRLLDASLLELGERSETQRRYDLARISAGFSYLEGKTGQQVARTTELMGYVLQASQKR